TPLHFSRPDSKTRQRSNAVRVDLPLSIDIPTLGIGSLNHCVGLQAGRRVFQFKPRRLRTVLTRTSINPTAKAPGFSYLRCDACVRRRSSNGWFDGSAPLTMADCGIPAG